MAVSEIYFWFSFPISLFWPANAADGHGLTEVQDQVAFVVNVRAEEAFGVWHADLVVAAKSRGVDRPAHLPLDHLKVLRKAFVCRLESDRVVFAIVVECDRL